MSPERRLAMQAAVAAGGAAAALMHFAVTCDNDEIAAAADECLEPLLCGALKLIDAAGVLKGEEDRRRLRTAIEDYITGPRHAEAGRCRICGCTEEAACVESADGQWFGPCAWTDATSTLCDNPDCLAKAEPELVS